MSAKTAKTAKTAKKTVKASTTAASAKPAKSAKSANTKATAAAARPMRAVPDKAPSRVSASHGKGRATALTRETLAGDIAAFRKAGGKIEVLGHTPLRPTSTPRASAKTPPAPVGSAVASKS